VIVDCVRAWQPRFNPSGVVEEASALLSYGCHSVAGDRYAGEWPREAFRGVGVGIEYAVAEPDRSRLYLELLPSINAGTIELPDDDKLLRELRGLERRRGSAGRAARAAAASELLSRGWGKPSLPLQHENEPPRITLTADQHAAVDAVLIRRRSSVQPRPSPGGSLSLF
jgi:hypothetical protein